MKEESNTKKGNYLRTKTERLIAALDMRYTRYFQAFAAQVLTEVCQFQASGDLARQIQKDAYLQVVKMRLNDQDNIDITQLLQLIDAELNQPSNLIVMNRAIQLLTKLSDFPALYENTQMQDNFLKRLM